MNFKKNKANYAPLTPIDFLERAAIVFPNYTSIITETKKFTWDETFNTYSILRNT